MVGTPTAWEWEKFSAVKNQAREESIKVGMVHGGIEELRMRKLWHERAEWLGYDE